MHDLRCCCWLQHSNRQAVHAVLHVTEDSLRVVDNDTKGLIVDQTIERVSFCAPDKNYEGGFSYICRDGTTRRWMCHGFIATKDSVRPTLPKVWVLSSLTFSYHVFSLYLVPEEVFHHSLKSFPSSVKVWLESKGGQAMWRRKFCKKNGSKLCVNQLK